MLNQMPLNRPADAISQFLECGHEGVAAAIVMTAVIDWRWPTEWADKCVWILGWDSLRQDVLAFWDNPTGQYLRCYFGLEDLAITHLPTCYYY